MLLSTDVWAGALIRRAAREITFRIDIGHGLVLDTRLMQVKRNGEDVGESVAVNVALGGTTTVNLGSAAAW